MGTCIGSEIFLRFSFLLDDVILQSLNAKEFSDNFPSLAENINSANIPCVKISYVELL
jgi:hypothetical protein